MISKKLGLDIFIVLRELQVEESTVENVLIAPVSHIHTFLQVVQIQDL